MLVIDPDECIDCSLCEPECPANAILSETDVPVEQQRFVALNRQLSRRWPVITRVGDRPVDADQWKDVPGKARFLDISAAGRES